MKNDKNFVLAYDLGTSSLKASVVDACGNVLASCAKEYPTYDFADGRHEQNPMDWWNCLVETTNTLFTENKELRLKIIEIALSGHSLGVVAVNKNGELLEERTPIWSDTRAESQTHTFFEKVDRKDWYATTGNGFNPCLYSVFKMMWYKEHKPLIYEKTEKFLGTKDYLNFILCGVMATDPSYASGSGVYDLRKGCYDLEYIRASGVQAEKFANIVPSDCILGNLTEESAKRLGLSSDVCVIAGGVDNACMSLGAGCIEVGDTYVSLGTSAWVATASRDPKADKQERINTWAHCIKGLYLPSAGVYSAGSALNWAMGHFAGIDTFEALEKVVASVPTGADGVMFVPVLSGGASTDESPFMKGLLCGVHLGTTQGEIAKAVLEGIAMEMRLAEEAIAEVAELGDTVRFVGGGASGKALLSVFADVWNKNIEKSSVGRQCATLGAAALAFVACGIWKDYNVLYALHKVEGHFQPNAKNASIYNTLMQRFRLACECSAKLY